MELIITPSASQEASRRLYEMIDNTPGILVCFFAGGSAQEVFTNLHLPEEHKRRTIFMMGDERWSRETSENNYLQLVETLGDRTSEYNIIDTSVRKDESLDTFVNRLNHEVEKIFSDASVRAVGLFGVGTDGHTASIFSMDEKSFQDTYERDSTYVSVHKEGLRSEYRASLTPGYIQNLNQVIAYAVGEPKKEVLLKLTAESNPIHEMPAVVIKEHTNAVLVTDQDIELM